MRDKEGTPAQITSCGAEQLLQTRKQQEANPIFQVRKEALEGRSKVTTTACFQASGILEN